MLDRDAEVLSRLIRINGRIMFEKHRQRLLRMLDRPGPCVHGGFDEPLDPIRLVGDEVVTHQ
jgi:hypothetical protein